MAIGRGLNTNNIGYNTTLNEIHTLAERTTNPVDIKLVLNKNGAYFNGDIYANNGYFHGNVHATNFILDGATAVSDFNSAITGSSAYNTLPSTREKLYYMSTSTSAPTKPKTKITTESTSSPDVWSLTMP